MVKAGTQVGAGGKAAVGVAVALCLVGCGDAGSGPVASERVKLTYCSDAPELAPDGSILRQREYFIASRINRQLADNSELRDYVGLSMVDSCEQARTFMKRKHEFLRLHPDYFDAEAEAGVGDGPVLPASEDGPGATTEKIAQGIPSTDTATVKLFIQKSATDTNGSQCSGFFIARRAIITAAHCLPPDPATDPTDPDGEDFNDKVLPTNITFTLENGGQLPIFGVNGVQNVNWFPHVSYSGHLIEPDGTKGASDFDDDLAVGIIPATVPDDLLPIPDANVDATTAMRLWLGNVRIGDNPRDLEFLGYGPPNTAGTGGGDQLIGFTTPVAAGSFFIDGQVFPGFPTVACNGDSGGPLIDVLPNLHPVAYGSLGGDTPPNEPCGVENGTTTWVRMRPKLFFIELKLKKACLRFNTKLDGITQQYARCF